MGRPEGWQIKDGCETCASRNVMDGCTAPGCYDDGFEAGADAMLEALIKQGRFNYAGYGTTDFPDARWGWFVFIPEG